MGALDDIMSNRGAAVSAAPAAAPSPGGGLAAIMGGGGSGSGAGEVGSVQNSNNKILDDIMRSGDGAAINQAQGIASHNAGGGWFNDILKAIDLPRAAVVSTLNQAAQGLGG